ncbi:hypothetical protein CA7LBN_002380 [Candidozyma auris]|uniref:Uncharacterized protein n=1 Tax=Candidozyma auris TaxID=498019 RepID=A0A8F3AGA9_CANAR|nr:hypothetical protein CA7LBN_002380 [[Candida] auris]
MSARRSPYHQHYYTFRVYLQQFVQKTPQKEILTIHATDYQRELLMCKYNLWLTQKELDKEKELREFLELERRMNEDEGETSDKDV